MTINHATPECYMLEVRNFPQENGLIWAAGASLLAQGGDQAAGRAQNGQWAGLGQGSDSRRTLMVEDQLANFGGAPRPSSHSTTPSRPAALAPSLAAGLTSPQNTV